MKSKTVIFLLITFLILSCGTKNNDEKYRLLYKEFGDVRRSVSISRSVLKNITGNYERWNEGWKIVNGEPIHFMPTPVDIKTAEEVIEKIILIEPLINETILLCKEGEKKYNNGKRYPGYNKVIEHTPQEYKYLDNIEENIIKTHDVITSIIGTSLSKFIEQHYYGQEGKLILPATHVLLQNKIDF
jgi:hypothetical protein